MTSQWQAACSNFAISFSMLFTVGTPLAFLCGDTNLQAFVLSIGLLEFIVTGDSSFIRITQASFFQLEPGS